nr:hypothetical protein [Tanacetum cinerariifolium]
MGTHDDEARSLRSKRPRQHETLEEVLLPQVHRKFLLWEGCSREAKSRYNTRLANFLPRHIYSPCVVNWDVLNRMGFDGEINDMLRIRLREDRSDEEIFTSRTTGYDKIQKNDLRLSSMFHARHQNGYVNVAWLIARWMKRKGA